MLLLWVSEKRCPYRGKFKIGAMQFRVVVKDLKRLSCRELLESEDPNDLVLAVLCRRDKDFWAKVKEMVYRLPEVKRKDFLMRLGVMVRLRSKTTLEYEKLIREVKEMPITIDVKRDPYYKKGYKEGIKEGIKEGHILEAQELVLEALEERFGKVEEEIVAKVKNIKDRAKLKGLFRLALRCQGLQEFKEALEGSEPT